MLQVMVKFIQFSIPLQTKPSTSKLLDIKESVGYPETTCHGTNQASLRLAGEILHAGRLGANAYSPRGN